MALEELYHPQVMRGLEQLRCSGKGDTQNRYTECLLEQRGAREITARVYKLPGAQRKEYSLVMLHFGGTERQKAALVPS